MADNFVGQYYMPMYRFVCYGEWKDAPAALPQVIPIAVDENGYVLTDEITSTYGLSDYGPFNLTTGGVTVYTPWVNINAPKALGFFIENTGGANITSIASSFSRTINGTEPTQAYSLVATITAGQRRYTSDWTLATAISRQTEVRPIIARSIRLGVHASGAVTTATIYIVAAND
jgi:hypothetical protein